jgi:acyl-coenzyme A synthetase/AMP-(fatty) acid ligase
MYYMLIGVPILIMADLSGQAVLDAAEAFKPTTVVAFPQTYAGLSELDLDSRDIGSIEVWMNTGDSAHERHIRPLVQAGSQERNGKREKGSVFLDGLGSSEMGFTLFRKIHSVRTETYNRCVGYPNEFVEAAVLGPDGELLPPDAVGMLGVKSPTVTSGYWNQSALTYRSRLNGYWLTGDMVYRDDKDMFYHVDRIQDTIRAADGPVYSLPMEEAVLNAHLDIRDAAVIGLPDLDGFEQPAAVLLVTQNSGLTAGSWLELLNRALVARSMRRLAFLAVTEDRKQLPCGPTGKTLKRELRERYRSALTDPEAALPDGTLAIDAAAAVPVGRAAASAAD